MAGSGMSVLDVDLYDILGLRPDASDTDIRKAYRKKALRCHPDKNPDNPKAAAEWDWLAKALEVLSDPEARVAYDKVLKARKATELRNTALDSKRRKIKEDLESREASNRNEQGIADDTGLQLQMEIERLRKEGSKTLEEEQELLKSEVLHCQSHDLEQSSMLKLKWKSHKGDVSNGGYNYDYLKLAFQKYGDVKNLVLSRKRNGSAIVEFSSINAAELAIKNEFGLPHNPLQLKLLTTRAEQWSHMGAKCTISTDMAFEDTVLQKLQHTNNVVGQGTQGTSNKGEEC